MQRIASASDGPGEGDFLGAYLDGRSSGSAARRLRAGPEDRWNDRAVALTRRHEMIPALRRLGRGLRFSRGPAAD
jgi:hypothetical protein